MTVSDDSSESAGDSEHSVVESVHDDLRDFEADGSHERGGEEEKSQTISDGKAQGTKFAGTDSEYALQPKTNIKS